MKKNRNSDNLFAIRLKDLRIAEGLTVYQLSKRIGLSHTTIGNYEAGLNDPTSEAIKKLCLLFKCTSDYLIGLSDESTLSPSAFECARKIDSMNRFEQEWVLFMIDAIKVKVDGIRRDRRFISEEFYNEIVKS